MRRSAALLVFAWMLAVGSGAGAAPAGLDLNGLWKTSEGELVAIRHQGTSVTAEFLVPEECPNGGTRTWWIQGTLSGTRLTGEMQRCTRDPKLIRDLGLSSLYKAKYQATVSADEIGGTYRSEYWAYDVEGDRFVNGRRDPSQDEDRSFSLQRTDCAREVAAARAEAERRADVLRDLRGMQKQSLDRFSQAADEGIDLLPEQLQEDITSLMLEASGPGAATVPDFPGDDNSDRIEKVLITTEWMVEEAGESTKAFPWMGIGDMVIDWVGVVAKQLTKLQEMDTIGQGIDKDYARVQEAEAAWREAWLRYQALLEKCPEEKEKVDEEARRKIGSASAPSDSAGAVQGALAARGRAEASLRNAYESLTRATKQTPGSAGYAAAFREGAGHYRSGMRAWLEIFRHLDKARGAGVS